MSSTSMVSMGPDIASDRLNMPPLMNPGSVGPVSPDDGPVETSTYPPMSGRLCVVQPKTSL